MADLKLDQLDPVVGLEVRIRGDRGLFEIIAVHPPNLTTIPKGWESFPHQGAEAGGTVDLKRLRSDSHFFSPNQGVPWSELQYVDDGEIWPVRHAIEWLKTNPGDRRFPDYIVDCGIKDGDDHAGNPSIFVRFFVDSEYFYEKNGRVSQERIAALNEFTFEVQQVLLGLNLKSLTYVQTSMARRALDAVS
jgi:hypothetical protein